MSRRATRLAALALVFGLCTRLPAPVPEHPLVGFTVQQALRQSMPTTVRGELTALWNLHPDNDGRGIPANEAALAALEENGVTSMASLLAIRDILNRMPVENTPRAYGVVNGNTVRATETRLAKILEATMDRGTLTTDFILPQFNKDNDQAQPDRYRQDLKLFFATDLTRDHSLSRMVGIIGLRHTLPPRANMREFDRTLQLIRDYHAKTLAMAAGSPLVAPERQAFGHLQNAAGAVAEITADQRTEVLGLRLGKASTTTAGAVPVVANAGSAGAGPKTSPVVAIALEKMPKALLDDMIKHVLDTKSEKKDRLFALQLIMEHAERGQIDDCAALEQLLPLLAANEDLPEARAGIARTLLAVYVKLRDTDAPAALRVAEAMLKLPADHKTLGWLRGQFLEVMTDNSKHAAVLAAIGEHICGGVLGEYGKPKKK